jgi:aminopeptidase-like protein
VRIDSKLFDGVLNFAELLIKGRSEDEVFISTHICHPSMANNELSGPTVVTYLVKWLLIKVSIIRLYHLA